ncbi:hypothetical protein CRUP_023236 [Coryphaenoides rupestris]|nr:hypothetical protein CRUP_023236 [Coryphaenoides rupestris]
MALPTARRCRHPNPRAPWRSEAVALQLQGLDGRVAAMVRQRGGDMNASVQVPVGWQRGAEPGRGVVYVEPEKLKTLTHDLEAFEPPRDTGKQKKEPTNTTNQN